MITTFALRTLLESHGRIAKTWADRFAQQRSPGEWLSYSRAAALVRLEIGCSLRAAVRAVERAVPELTSTYWSTLPGEWERLDRTVRL